MSVGVNVCVCCVMVMVMVVVVVVVMVVMVMVVMVVVVVVVTTTDHTLGLNPHDPTTHQTATVAPRGGCTRSILLICGQGCVWTPNFRV